MFEVDGDYYWLLSMMRGRNLKITVENIYLNFILREIKVWINREWLVVFYLLIQLVDKFDISI